MAITGTIIIPEKELGIADITGVELHRESGAYFHFDGGSVNCSIAKLWGVMTTIEKSAVSSIIKKIADKSSDNITLSGDF